MVTIEKVDLSLIENIEPNFTQRRLDFSEPEKAELLKISDNEKNYYIPILPDGKNCDISVELAEIPQKIFKSTVKWIFKNYPKVKKVNFLESLNNYPENTFSYSATAYKTILPETKELFLNNIASKIRYNYGYNQRRLTKAYGNIEFKKYDKVETDLIQRYFELKKITHGKNYEYSPEEYIKNYHITEGFELLVAGETASIVLLSVINENIYVENLTYNTNFSKYSPGTILLIYMILDSIENPKYKNIFWGAYNDYKKHLSNKTYKVYYGSIYRSAFSYNFKKFCDFIFKTKRENGKKVFIFCNIPLNLKK